MRRKACALLMSATLGGCMSFDSGPESTPACSGSWGRQYGPPAVPGLAGPHGQNVPMAQPYASNPPGNAYVAKQMMSRSVPLDMVQINRGVNAGMAPGMMPGMMQGPGGAPGSAIPPTPIPPGGVLTPPGMPFAPGAPAGPNITPTSFTQGPGPGIINAHMPQGPTGGIMTAQYAIPNPALQGHPHVAAQRTQVRFVRPTGMKISWFTQGPDGRPAYSNIPLEAPARYNFPQAAIYRLKLSNIEARPGLEIYPTMEVVPSNPKTDAFLAHSAVPLEFTQEDFKQVVDGNYVTKVIYLPDPQFQDIAGAGIDEIVSTRLEPGADPVQEALRRGSILLIIRMGNVDQEAPNTPPLGAVNPLQPPVPAIGPGHGPGPGHPGHLGHGAPPAFQVPYIGNRPILPPMPGGPVGPGAPRNPLAPPPPPGPQLPPPAPRDASVPPSQFVPPAPGVETTPGTAPSNPFNSSVPSGLTPSGLTPSGLTPSTGSLPPATIPVASPKLPPKNDVPPLPSVPLPGVSVPSLPNTSSRGPVVPMPTASKADESVKVASPVLPTPVQGGAQPAIVPAAGPASALPAPVVIPASNDGPANVQVQPVGASDLVVPPPALPQVITPTTQRPELPTIISGQAESASSAPQGSPPDIQVPAPERASVPALPSADLPSLPALPPLPR